MKLFDHENIKNAVAFFAHPDDAESSSGGAIYKLAKNDISVTVVVIAKGDKGKSNTEIRQVESEKAAEVLKINKLINLGYSDGEFENNLVLREQITNIIREQKPELVICPDPEPIFFADAYINHRDHRETGRSVVDVISSAVNNEKYFPNSKAHNVAYLLCAGTKEPNCIVDISDCIEKKLESIACYQSQLGNNSQAILDGIKENSKRVGKIASVEHGEAYRLVSITNSEDLI